MKRPRLRALVLTAGYGERLRPLTLFVPKPLLPICGEPVVGHTLRQLGKAGCEAAALNLHHLPEAIPRFLGRRYFGLPIRYSPEEEIQGTLGALYPQREFLAAADAVLVVNGDTLCRWPFRRLIRRHLRSGADITLLVHRRQPDEALGGGVGVGSDGRVVQLRDSKPVAKVASRHVFAGAHVLSPRILQRIQAGPADIVGDLYIPLLRDGGRIQGLVTSTRWHDLGTPERYLEANLDWVRGRRPLRRRHSRISPLAEIAETATVRHSIVEEGAVVGEEARIEGSVLLSGARVADGSRIANSIIGPGAQLTASANIEGRMINRLRIGHQPSPHESVMGELVFTPLA
ncbi:MAG: NDP-sugar synthase [bacterium]|nr:NDP-sugar synthase [bacterium]